MDQAIRNKLRGVVTQCRRLLEESVSQELQGKFGIYAGKKDAVQVDDDARMTHLSQEERTSRKDIIDHFEHIKARGFEPRDALAQMVREIAYTHLNRLCAYKMMEAREVYVGDQKFREAVSRGVNSNGVKFYLADNPDDERLYTTGKQDVAYRHFLDWLGGLLSEEIGVLFNPNDPANRLYPTQKTLNQILALLNDETLVEIWTQDETIGWIYQYFTPKELRDAARDQKRGGSLAPRNSYELAFRNQFFTPRYVVEFLTDNTLGRIWYEMRKGDTKLKDQCRYMVCRPNESFLAEGQQPPKENAGDRDDLRTPNRPKKDPRELKILDPACGSGHFLLYCFDLLLTIYQEAYEDPDLGAALKKDYPTLADLQKCVPGLILSRNLHGIDIDLRTTQIAALALWLRCQRAYQDMGLKKDRPKIIQSNFVCAEPMPGEEHMLKEFVSQLEPKLLGQLVEVVFQKMRLAGEAGSLLKIEQEIRATITEAKKQWASETERATDRQGHRLLFSRADMDRLANKPPERQLFDLSAVTDDQFFGDAEARVIEALQAYAEQTYNGHQFQRRLFAEDAVRGFAFVDICRKRFDVLLMNPPFGLPCQSTYSLIVASYPTGYADLAAAFISLCTRFLHERGSLGSITTRAFLQSSDLGAFRNDVFLPNVQILLDLGPGVMDEAWVEASAQVLGQGKQAPRFVIIDRRHQPDEFKALPTNALPLDGDRLYYPERTAFDSVPKHRVAYDATSALSTLIKSASRLKPDHILATTGLRTFDDERYYRLRWEVRPSDVGPALTWCDIAKNAEFGCYYMSYCTLVKWCGDGRELAKKNIEVNGQTAQARQGSRYYFKPGLCFSRRSEPTFAVRVHPASAAFSSNGGVILPKDTVSAYYLAGLLNSSPFRAAVRLLANKYSYTSGHVEVLAWCDPDDGSASALEAASKEAIVSKLLIERTAEIDPYFVGFPSLRSHDSIKSCAAAERVLRKTLSERIVRCGEAIDAIVCNIYSLQVDRDELAANYRTSVQDLTRSEASIEVGDGEYVAAVISYAVGSLFGRWDLRYSTGDRKEHSLPDPFGSLPACAIGMLRDASDLPAMSVPEEYPVRIDWDGILVDDPGHLEDIVRRVRDVLEVIWKHRADAVEKEACEILDVEELREYFRKPGKCGFWDDHVSCYSKSRRNAPIYWLLQSSKKNYALWLYYHRLDKDLLFKALVNYVEPKIQRETNRLDELRMLKQSEGGSGKGVKKLDKDVERQEDLISELRDFEDKLRRAANLHLEPDLSDGVVLNIAPLHEIVPWKEARNYWAELLEGGYEWSSIGKQLRQKGVVK